MTRWSGSIAPLALVMWQLGCTQPPPPDTRAADVQAIRDVEAAMVKAVAAKDLDKNLAFYTDDASLLPTDMPVQTGKDAVRGVFKAMLADPNLAIDFSASKVEVSKAGDLGYSQGTYTMTSSDPKTKKPMTEKGKYVTVFRKQADGSWKAVEHMASADAPATPATSAAKK